MTPYDAFPDDDGLGAPIGCFNVVCLLALIGAVVAGVCVLRAVWEWVA